MHLLLLYVAFANVLNTLAAPTVESLTTAEEPRVKAAVLHDLEQIDILPNDVIEKLKEKCKDGKCLIQKDEAIATKKFLRNELIAQQKKYNNGTVDIAAIDRRFQKTFQLKQEILNRQGIGEFVAAADDGLFDGDMFLNEHQADEMLRNMNNRKSTNNKAGVALFFDSPDQEKFKWNVKKTIYYTVEFLEDLSYSKEIKAAFNNLMDKVPCLRFEYTNNPGLFMDAWLEIKRSLRTSKCGITTFGRASAVGPTSVYVSSSNEYACTPYEGNLLHYVMHALGVLHMHQRYDRDQYINIFYNILNSKEDAKMEFLMADDKKRFSTYGTKYDLRSVMHSRIYELQWDYDGAELFAPKNFTNLRPQDIGKYKELSDQDALLLNEMYCLNPKCSNEVDLRVCQAMFTRNKCNVAIVRKWCRRTCNLCPE